MEQGWVPLAAQDGWFVSDAQCVAADPAGGVWIGTENDGLFQWNKGMAVPRLCATNGLAGIRVYALLTTSTGALWIGAGTPDTPQQALQCLEKGQLRTFPCQLRAAPLWR
jgi:ligand-binding sensor domain-containing protein